MTSSSPRLLIIRFSSYGDIFHAVSVPEAYLKAYPLGKVDWLVREDFAHLLEGQTAISKVISYSRQSGLSGLFRLARNLSQSGYTHVYDAHSNVRSHFFTLFFSIFAFVGKRPLFIRRSKERLRRILLFKFHLKTLPQPYRAAESFHRPLKPWGIDAKVGEGPRYQARAPLPADVLNLLKGHGDQPLIALAPSAAWEMKRWPVGHWVKLIEGMPECRFVVLGGPTDAFTERLQVNDRVINLSGKLTLSETPSVLALSDLVIANDTGVLHASDQMARPTIALIGPTAFGYPSHATSQTLEVELPCKPCSKDGRGGCSNSIYQRCLVDITPERVIARSRAMLKAKA